MQSLVMCLNILMRDFNCLNYLYCLLMLYLNLFIILALVKKLKTLLRLLLFFKRPATVKTVDIVMLVGSYQDIKTFLELQFRVTSPPTCMVRVRVRPFGRFRNPHKHRARTQNSQIVAKDWNCPRDPRVMRCQCYPVHYHASYQQEDHMKFYVYAR